MADLGRGVAFPGRKACAWLWRSAVDRKDLLTLLRTGMGNPVPTGCFLPMGVVRDRGRRAGEGRTASGGASSTWKERWKGGWELICVTHPIHPRRMASIPLHAGAENHGPAGCFGKASEAKQYAEGKIEDG
jgi:hypothetical protein